VTRKLLLSAIAAGLLMAGNAHSEVLIGLRGANLNGKKTASVPALEGNRKVWVRCGNCESFAGYLQQQLVAAGPTIVETTDEADTRLIVHLEIAVPEDGRAPFVDAGNLFEKSSPVIPPPLTPEGGRIAAPEHVARGIFNLDGGHVAQGAQLTGSTGGGIVVALLGGFLFSALEKQEADKQRTPGIMRGFVRVTEANRKHSFGYLGAASTEETPDGLARGALASLVKLLGTGGETADSNAQKGKDNAP
jgi:hypothetical protein